MSLELSLSCGTRDLNEALLTGAVEPTGIDLTVIPEYPPRRHRRFFERGDFDVCEVSLASYVSSRSAPEEYPFTAIPVFPAKRFRHSFFFKHKDADIKEPADLEGRKVGCQSWQTTANVWVRGIMQEHYDLDLTEVEWYRRKEDDVPVDIPEKFDIRTIPGPQGGEAIVEPNDFREMFFSGELVAAMDPAGSFFHDVLESEDAELFFENPIEEERAYYEETGIHPIMHTVAIRDEILEEHPWVAVNLFDAYCESRDRCLDANRSPSTNTSITWAHLHLDDQREVLGEDAWEFGLTDRTTREVEKFVEYATDQGLAPRAYDPAELFADVSVAR